MSEKKITVTWENGCWVVRFEACRLPIEIICKDLAQAAEAAVELSDIASI